MIEQYFSLKNVPAADTWDFKEQNRLALEQLDLQVQKLLADTSVLIDKSRGGYIKFQILVHLNKPFSSSMSSSKVVNYYKKLLTFPKYIKKNNFK